MRTAIAAFGLLLSFGLPGPLRADEPAPGRNLGLPFFETFEPRDYHGHTQVWGIAEDAAGILYFGNYDGVLTYDGARWDRIDLPGASFVRGVAIDDHDVLWLAGVNELGYATIDASGRRTFVSLRDRVPAAARNFGELWRLTLTPHGVLFQSNTWLLRWDGTKFATLALPEGAGWQSFAAGGRTWVSHGQHGWFTLEDDGTALALAPVTRPAAYDHLALMFAVPGTKPGEIIFATIRKGFVRWDGQAFTPFPTEVDTIIKQRALYRGIRLADGRLVLCLLQGGAFILDPAGRLLASIDEKAGLPSSGVKSAFATRAGAVWFTLDRGLLQMDARPWLSWFGAARGAPRSPLRPPVRFHGELYTISDDGLLRLAPAAGDAPAHFEAVPEIPDYLEGIEPVGDSLIVYGRNLEEWHGPGTKPVRLPDDPGNCFDFVPAHSQPGRWFGLTDGGVSSYRHDGAKWTSEGPIKVLGNVRSLAEETDGTWWMGTPNEGVLRVTFPGASATGPGEPVVQRFEAKNGGLPAGHGWTRVSLLGGRPLLRCEKGLFRLDATGQHWVPTAEYGARFADGSMTTRSMTESPRDGLWLAARPAGQAELVTTIDLGVLNAQGWRPLNLPQLARLDDVSGLEYDEADDVLWIGGYGGLVRVDLARWRAQPPDPAPAVVLRRVEAGGSALPLAGAWRLPYAQRSLSVQFAAPALAGDPAARYETVLAGGGEPVVFTDGVPQREFSALAAGDYRLRFRARRGDGAWSEPLELAFTVLPPWWRSGWAWTGYAALAAALVAAYIRTRTRALRRRAAQLEATVAARTEDLRRSNTELARLNRLELDEKIAAKLAEEKARLELLRYQLNPHFLLNAFTTLRGLVFTAPAAAGDMVAKLAEFCRFALTRTDATGGTVADEVKLIETYLATEQSRWRDNLVCSVEADPTAAAVRLPPFLLQPLVENAVKYGGRTSPDKLEVRVRIAPDGAGGLRIEVANTGEWVADDSPHRQGSTGLGLDNLRQRLRRYYPDAHSLDTQSAGGWVRIVLHLSQPARDPFAPTHPAH